MTSEPNLQAASPAPEFRPSRFEIRPSAIVAGQVGLFAVRSLAPGELLFGKQDGLRWMRLDEFERLSDESRAWVLRWCVGWPEGYLVPVDSDALSLTWYFNHACDGNVGFNEAGEFVTLRRVEAGEELVYDYALADVLTDPILEECSCGSAHCRGRISGLDWRDDAWWRRSGAFAHPVVRRARATAQG